MSVVVAGTLNLPCRSEGGQPSEQSRGPQQRRGDSEHQATNGTSQRYVSSIPGLTHRQEQVLTLSCPPLRCLDLASVLLDVESMQHFPAMSQARMNACACLPSPAAAADHPTAGGCILTGDSQITMRKQRGWVQAEAGY